jgi:methyl-accepting chemotaxis protein
VRSEILFEVQRAKLKEELISPIKQHSKKKISVDTLFQPVNRLRSKTILITIIVMFKMIVVLMISINNITKLLQLIIKTAQKISKYDLLQLIRMKLNNGLNKMSKVINKMLSNLHKNILITGY